MLKSRVGIQLTNSFGVIPTRLYPLNKDVDNINDKELDNLAKVDSIFYQYDIEFKVYSSKNADIIIDKYRKHTIAPETLQLVIGAQVMLIHNLDIDSKLVNGSRGIITGFSNNIPIVKFITGEERVIDYHTWDIEECDVKILSITQIPLKLAWATSIHKSQGCSLDYVEIDLENIFEYGQSYCGLSRVKTLEGLSIISLDLDKIKAHKKKHYFSHIFRFLAISSDRYTSLFLLKVYKV
jgi:ATP-dependent DNA helicase PIF1